MDPTAILIIDHGSRRRDFNEAMEDLGSYITGRLSELGINALFT